MPESKNPPATSAPAPTPAPTPAPPKPDPSDLTRAAQFLAWIQTEIHPQYGGGQAFGVEDIVYWLGRYEAKTAECRNDVPKDDADTRFHRVKQALLSEYRIYGKQGQFRPRVPKTAPSAALAAPDQTKSAAGPLRVRPPRALEDDIGPCLECGIDDLRLMLLWDVNQEAAMARIREHAERGYTWIHVLAHNWSVGLSKNSPGHLMRMVAITKYVYQTGGRVQWTLVGDRTGGLEKVNVISQFVRDATRALKECAYGVAAIQIAGERQMMTDVELETLMREGKANLPTTLFATTEADSLDHAALQHGDLLMSALDPWTGRGEGVLRTWRQPYGWRYMPRPWIARGTGGPSYPFKDSPANPEMLRSHRLAAFISGACVSIYQSSAGAFGEDFRDLPSYGRCGAFSVLPQPNQHGNFEHILPSDLPNGEVIPESDHFLSLPPDATILTSGQGALALLSRRLKREKQEDTYYYHLIGQNADVRLKVHKAGTVVAFNPEHWKELFQDTLHPGNPLQLTLPRNAKFQADTWLLVTP